VIVLVVVLLVLVLVLAVVDATLLRRGIFFRLVAIFVRCHQLNSHHWRDKTFSSFSISSV